MAGWISRGTAIFVGMILLPVLFRHLPQTELSIWLLLGQSWATISILDLGFGLVLTRKIAFAKVKHDQQPTSAMDQEIADLMTTGLAVHRVLAILAFCVAFGLGFGFLRQMNIEPGMVQSTWIAWAVLCLSQAFSVWAAPWTCLLQGVGYVGWDTLLNSVVNACVCCIQIVIALQGGGLIQLAAVAALGALIQRLVIVRFSKKRSPEFFSAKGKFSKLILQSMLPQALLAWLTAIGYMAVTNSDQLFLASFDRTAELPAYRSAHILLVNLHLVSGVFAGASHVFVSQLWEKKDLGYIRLLLQRNAQTGLLAMSVGGAVIFSLGPIFFDLWLGAGHFVGREVLFLLWAALFLEHQANAFATAGRATGDEAYAWTSLLAGALKLPLAYFGVKLYGLAGLAASTLIAQGVTNSWYMVYRTSRRFDISFSHHVKSVLVPCLVCFFAVLAFQYGANFLIGSRLNGFWQCLSVILFGGTLLSFAIWALVLSLNERKRILQWLRLA